MSSEQANEAAATTTSGGTSAESHSASCTRAELTELVRAIRFSKPNASAKEVHAEITETLSQHSNFEFLASVPLNDVKKVWKKANQRTSTNSNGSSSCSAETAAVAELVQRNSARNSDGTVSMFTVGDGSVRSLAREYSQAAAARQVEQAALPDNHQDEQNSSISSTANNKNFVHAFLDVPADRSGSLPYQAILRFQEYGTLENDNSIVKIQIAAAPDSTVKFPMLLYNADRSVKTFIHPDPGDDGYERIQRCIGQEGTRGVLGSMGGTKAYFYSVVTKQKEGPDVISVDVSKLAPGQRW